MFTCSWDPADSSIGLRWSLRNSHEIILIIGLDDVQVYWFVEKFQTPHAIIARFSDSIRDEDIIYYLQHPLENRVKVRNFGLQNRLVYSRLQVEDLRTSDDNMTIGCEVQWGRNVDTAKTSIRVYRKFFLTWKII